SHADSPGGLQFDAESIFGGLPDRQVGGLAALEDATGLGSKLTERVSEACSIAHQPAGFRIVAKRIRRGQSAEHRQERQLDTPVVKERGALDEQTVGSFANKGCEGRL